MKYYLDVKENFMGLNHYYEDNILPSKEETIAKINQVIFELEVKKPVGCCKIVIS